MSLFARIKKLASETAIYGISSIVGRMIGFVLFPLYSHVFPPNEYGIVSIVFASFIFLNVVYQYGMESAYLKYASDAETAEGRRITFSTAVYSLLGTGVVFSAGIVLFQDVVGLGIGLGAEWRYLLYYAALILLLDTITTIPFAELRLQSRPIRFAVIRMVNILVNVGMNLWLIFGLEMGIEAVFIANVTASAVSVLMLVPTLLEGLQWRFDGGLWRQLMRFGLPFVPGGLGYAVTERINIFFLEAMPDDRVLALYSAALTPEALAHLSAAGTDAGSYIVGVFNGCLKLAVFMTLVVQMFRYAWQPFFLQHAKDADAKQLFARIFTLFTAAGLLVLLAVSFFAQELVSLPLPNNLVLIREDYWLGLFIIPPALLGYLFQGWYYNFSAGAYIEKQTKYFIHCTLAGAVVALGLNALLTPYFGMLAAVWATTLSYAVMALMLYVLVRRFYPTPYDWGKILSMGALAAGLFFLWNSVPMLQKWWIEAGLLGVYLAGLVGLGIVPLDTLRRTFARLR